MGLKNQGVPLWGIAYKDKADDAQAFLQRHGNPYDRLARDERGRVAIEFGLYGVPETYLIDRTGIVRWRWAGGLSDEVVSRELAPLLRTYA
jgi:cytochrome c biogenesis protein CcmG/thiol:disulfide interchange protein DsbE